MRLRYTLHNEEMSGPKNSCFRTSWSAPVLWVLFDSDIQRLLAIGEDLAAGHSRIATPWSPTLWESDSGIRMHYIPEHCNLHMVASLYFGVEKATCFNWLPNFYLLRSPVIGAENPENRIPGWPAASCQSQAFSPAVVQGLSGPRACGRCVMEVQLSHNQNRVLNWSTQNHVQD